VVAMFFEIISGVYVVAGFPAIYLRHWDSLIIADLHLGFEESIASKGFYVPYVQLNKIIEKLKQVLALVKPSRVIINGDIKHEFGRLLRQEREEVIKLVEFLRSNKIHYITVVRGNHDNFISYILEKLGVGFVDVLTLNSIVLTHGHLDLEPNLLKGELIIIGHEHPAVILRDELGTAHKFSCLAIGELNTGQKVLIMPSLSIYAAGNVLTPNRESYLSPLIRKHCVVEKLKPYIIDEELGVLELPNLETLATMGYF